MKKSTENFTIPASFVIHAALAGLLVYEGQQALIAGSVRGSRPTATVSFDIVQRLDQEKPKPKKAEAKMFQGPSEVIVAKKRKKKKVVKIDKKVLKRLQAEKTSDGVNRAQQVSLIGFDLRNIKGNLSPELQAFFNSLRADIERRKPYPKMAKRLRQTGEVILRFEISRDGKIKNVIVDEPSRYRSLNEAAQKLISNLKGSYPLPSTIQANAISIRLPVNYSL